MFAPLPESFARLEAVVRQMDTVTAPRPPAIESIGRRLRAAFERARQGGYSGLTAGELRKLPYAWWLPSERPLHELHPQLVQLYWGQVLPSAIASGPRRAKRWLTPLFFTYCEAFDPRDEWFADFAARLRTNLERSEGSFAERLKDLDRSLGLFTPQVAAPALAASLMGHPASLEMALEQHLLWPKFVETRLGAATFDAVLASGDQRLSDSATVVRVLAWARLLGSPVSRSVHRVNFADSLLRPWQRRSPPDQLKATLIDFLVRDYGDPRMGGNRQYQWRDVSPEALRVIMTWLAGDTLRGFMRILERTADEIWRYRQNFWMAYYQAGHVEEAWLALGPQAASLARRLQADERGLGYGRLDGGAAPDQSVLLLRIGNLVLTEWSHNGSLRACRDIDPDAPALYMRSYHGAELRAIQSMDFHDGMNQNPELRHMNSGGGTWQRKARDFIRRHTGVHLDDRQIL
jgi:hypothetical protein